MDLELALIHPPLCGPAVWEGVRGELEAAGHAVRVPAALGWEDGPPPYSERFIELVARRIGPGGDLCLAGHSGAGPLLEAIADRVGGARGLIYVDAFLRRPAVTSLDWLTPREGGLVPAWATDEDLRNEVPDDTARAGLLREIRPLPPAFFEEPQPGGGGPRRRSAYLLFSPVYADAYEQAASLGMPRAHLPGGHFHMLADPKAVADALLMLCARLNV